MAKLLIVESPAKAKTITKYLGAGYQVKASMGHLRDLPKKELGVDVDHDFQTTYIPIPGKDKVIQDLRSGRPISSIWPPTRTGRGRPSPGTCPSCWSWTPRPRPG